MVATPEGHPESTSRDDGFLHLGDQISLFDDAGNGFIGTQGFANVQIGVEPTLDSNPPASFTHECIFVVKQQMNFSVSKQLRMLLDREGITLEDAGTEVKVGELLVERDREQRQNALEFEQSKGSSVRYGMVVQLQHASSHKFICVSRQAAERSADSRRCQVEREGDERSWMRIMPWLKVRWRRRPQN